MLIALIRHGQTRGNLENRYVGRTDEPLCETGILTASRLARQDAYPDAQNVYISPARRTRQTARILYPDVFHIVLEGLRECDFGAFEYKTYEDLRDSADYRAWIDSGGLGRCPGGETGSAFRARCCAAFTEAVAESLDAGCGEIAFIAHGGTIMAILERFARPSRAFYDWQTPPCCGYLCEIPRETWEADRRFEVLGSIPPENAR